MKFVIALALIGCRTSDKTISDTGTVNEQIDQDGDGFFSNEDCNDADAQVYPGAEEVCDGIDNNCDGQFDEEVTTTFYADSDSDGYGNPDIITEACEQPSGYVPQGTDCDDTQSSVYPSAEEVCDGLDNDCDGLADEGEPESGDICTLEGQSGLCAQGVTACRTGLKTCLVVLEPGSRADPA